jgi:hypothetical protein
MLGALFDVSAGKGEDVASPCAGFKDLSHWLKVSNCWKFVCSM